MTTCEQIRERLPEFVLGVGPQDDDVVRRHLRGCAGCRADARALGDGLTSFAHAVHDRQPPPELQDQVRAALQEEWRDPVGASSGPSRRPRWAGPLAVAAAIALVASFTLAVVQTRRADSAQEGARRYEGLIEILGGREFRAAQLHPAGDRPLEGSVVVYDSHVDQSWVVVFVRTSGPAGEAVATLRAPDGRTIDTWPIEIDRDGDGAGWLVTSVDLASFDRVTLTGTDGEVMATGEIAGL